MLPSDLTRSKPHNRQAWQHTYSQKAEQMEVSFI